MTKYSVGGFTFTDEQSAKKAAKELKAVEYIISQLKDASDDDVLKLYNKLVAQKMFTTEVGLSFLEQLKQNLIVSGKIKEDKKNIKNDSKDIPKKVEIKDKKNSEGIEKQTKPKNNISESSQIIKLKRINVILTVVSVTLGLIVLGMFYVSSTINSPTILNYEEEILNKYSKWEHDLSEREDAIRKKEQSLD